MLAPSSLIQILTRKESRIYGSQVPNLVRLFKHICRNDWKLLNSVNIIVSLRYWRRDNACVWSNTVLPPMFCPLFYVLLYTRNNTDMYVLHLEIQRARHRVFTLGDQLKCWLCSRNDCTLQPIRVLIEIREARNPIYWWIFFKVLYDQIVLLTCLDLGTISTHRTTNLILFTGWF